MKWILSLFSPAGLNLCAAATCGATARCGELLAAREEGRARRDIRRGTAQGR